MKNVLCLLLAVCFLLTPLCVLAENDGVLDPFDDPILIGDVTQDGRINASDYMLLKRYILRTLSFQFNEKQLIAADVTQDKKINASDYLLLKRTIMAR